MKIFEVTKRVPVLEATADEVRARLQQRLSDDHYQRTMSWIEDDYNGFASQADVDAFIQDAASDSGNFWQMPYARNAREAIFGIETGAGQRDGEPIPGVEPLVRMDDPQATGRPEGSVLPRPQGIAGADWDRRYSATHNPDGSPKATDEPEDTQDTPTPAPDTTDDDRAARTNAPEPAATPPAEEPAATPPAEEPAAAAGGVDGPDGQPQDLGQIRQTLRRGSRGNGVIALQQRLGINADGIFGPQTEQAVRQFQQQNNLQVDGIVGAQTLAALQGRAAAAPGRIQAPAPTSSPRPQARPQQNASKENTGNALTEGARIAELAGTKKTLNEASVTINGAAEEIAELMRMMQLAGAQGAKPVDVHDINPSPKPMPTPCGAPKIGPAEPSMGDMIRMMSSEEMATEEVDDGGFEDATTEPDEYTAANAGDVSDVIPDGNDLHKEKDAYPPVNGGDNPMKIKEQLMKALAEKKKCKTNKR